MKYVKNFYKNNKYTSIVFEKNGIKTPFIDGDVSTSEANENKKVAEKALEKFKKMELFLIR